jgi:transcriptional regulator with XRE-family HTH domain
MRTATPATLRELMQARGLTLEAAAVLAEVDPATISRIMNGRQQARPVTIVRLARGLGIGARRMQAMCEAHWLDAHPDERLSA